MKQIVIILAAAAFLCTTNVALCGDDKPKEEHKCSEACKNGCKAKDGQKCSEACKDKCAKKNSEGSN